MTLRTALGRSECSGWDLVKWLILCVFSRSEVYLKFMEGHTPPSTLVPVPCLADPEYLYEIEVMAVVEG